MAIVANTPMHTAHRRETIHSQPFFDILERTQHTLPDQWQLSTVSTEQDLKFKMIITSIH